MYIELHIHELLTIVLSIHVDLWHDSLLATRGTISLGYLWCECYWLFAARVRLAIAYLRRDSFSIDYLCFNDNLSIDHRWSMVHGSLLKAHGKGGPAWPSLAMSLEP